MYENDNLCIEGAEVQKQKLGDKSDEENVTLLNTPSKVNLSDEVVPFEAFICKVKPDVQPSKITQWQDKEKVAPNLNAGPSNVKHQNDKDNPHHVDHERVAELQPREQLEWKDFIAREHNKQHPHVQRAHSLKMISLKDVDARYIGSQWTLVMEHDYLYYLQHPTLRVLVVVTVLCCNIFMYLEDPVSHSVVECNIPVLGNALSLLFIHYPKNLWSLVKIFSVLVGLLFGLWLGHIIHSTIFARFLHLQMFSINRGSWLVKFFTTILVLALASYIYNLLLIGAGTYTKSYRIDSHIGINNALFTKVAAVLVWIGDIVTVWMVLDVMLQDLLYPKWRPKFRKWWRRKGRRVLIFWIVFPVSSIVIISLVAADLIHWDNVNKNQLYLSEFSRAMLASAIVVMDFLIILQDWDFPHFVNDFHIRLPGVSIYRLNYLWCKKIRIDIMGKWFNYGILCFVIILDMHMWIKQITYRPIDYGQFVGPDFSIYTPRDTFTLAQRDIAIYYTYNWRNLTVSSLTNNTYISADHKIKSTYKNFSLEVKTIAIVPNVIIFIVFIGLILKYGRERNFVTLWHPYRTRLMKRRRYASADNTAFGITSLTDQVVPLSKLGIKATDSKDRTHLEDLNSADIFHEDDQKKKKNSSKLRYIKEVSPTGSDKIHGGLVISKKSQKKTPAQTNKRTRLPSNAKIVGSGDEDEVLPNEKNKEQLAKINNEKMDDKAHKQKRKKSPSFSKSSKGKACDADEKDNIIQDYKPKTNMNRTIQNKAEKQTEQGDDIKPKRRRKSSGTLTKKLKSPTARKDKADLPIDKIKTSQKQQTGDKVNKDIQKKRRKSPIADDIVKDMPRNRRKSLVDDKILKDLPKSRRRSSVHDKTAKDMPKTSRKSLVNDNTVKDIQKTKIKPSIVGGTVRGVKNSAAPSSLKKKTHLDVEEFDMELMDSKIQSMLQENREKDKKYGGLFSKLKRRRSTHRPESSELRDEIEKATNDRGGPSAKPVDKSSKKKKFWY